MPLEMIAAQQVMDRLIWDHKWYVAGAASATAMCDAESSFRWTVEGDKNLKNTAHGGWQWRLERYDGTLHPTNKVFVGLLQYAKEFGPHHTENDWTNWTVQVDYFNFDRARRSEAEKNWHLCTDIMEGVLAGQKFESYSGPLQPKRTALAEAFYAEFHRLNPRYDGK